MTSAEFFVTTSINAAKHMPLKESIEFLHGFLTVAQESSAEPFVRRALTAVRECDQQLELIASGQMKLPLPETKKGSRK